MSLLTLLKHRNTNASKDIQKSINTFINRLSRYQHVPVEKKHILRMQKFANDSNIIHFYQDSLVEYLTNFDETDFAEDNYDIVTYWYGIALLSLSEDEEATQLIQALVTKAVQNSSCLLWMYRRHFRLLPDATLTKFYQQITLIENYFVTNQVKYQAYQLAQTINLQLPDDDNWQIDLRIKTTGSSLNLSICIHPLDDTGTWRIMLRDDDGTHAIWFEASNDLVNPRCLMQNPHKKSLTDLHQFIKTIETAYQVSFDFDSTDIFYSGKIKNKKQVEKWLHNGL